jgi:hypothetical protein
MPAIHTNRGLQKFGSCLQFLKIETDIRHLITLQRPDNNRLARNGRQRVNLESAGRATNEAILIKVDSITIIDFIRDDGILAYQLDDICPRADFDRLDALVVSIDHKRMHENLPECID